MTYGRHTPTAVRLVPTVASSDEDASIDEYDGAGAAWSAELPDSLLVVN